MSVTELVQQEDLIRWGLEFYDGRELQLLWYPEYNPLTPLGLFLFANN